MKNLRKYGEAPFSTAVLHGGPGAPGQMAPLAKALSAYHGILEPLQTANSVEGQVQELKDTLQANGALPVTLIGSSWGAMLAFIFGARYPSFVKKLILVGSGCFEEKDASDITATRLKRMSDAEREEAEALMKSLGDPDTENRDKLMARLGGKLFFQTDNYEPVSEKDEVIKCDYKQHVLVWSEAQEMRSSGELLELGRKIRCPVVAIHGDYDPHPAEGIRRALSGVIENFRFVLLRKCGHLPWLELHARKEFYEIIAKELS